MSHWYWKVIALKAAFVLSCFVTYLKADDNVQKLPYCNPHNNANGGAAIKDLVIVSTLDGKLTAFSTDNGIKAWDLETQPLLSSNLHHVELTSGGKWVRLVPSLRGSLYSLSGDTIEPLPFDAEQLLSSSFKYSEDLVIAGARETLWLGLDANSGSIIYECSSSGCNSEQQTASAGRDVLVLRRHSNTVRALDPRSGTEKWNFSVAEHNLALSRRECAGGSPGEAPLPVAVAVAVSLPDGVVAVRRPHDSSLLWRQKLEAPVAGMWRLQGGSIQNIDVLLEATHSLVESNAPLSPPSLYIGVHNTQIYIQESILYTKKLDTAVSAKPVPWKVRHSTPLLDDGRGSALSLQDSDPNTLSLITLYGSTEPGGNHGFFLYLQETCDQSIQVNEEAIDGPEIVPPNSSEEHEHHIHVHAYSLWFWWKEVLLIAISSALLMNLMIWPRFFAPKIRPSTPIPVNQENIIVERYYERPVPPTTTEYSGRYENDFTPLRCLGRGGFGVVFEARNNIDHCSYAVKRITLPRRESKRERVLREVRALAKLEHEHIVRYFNAWLEEPPPLWQQKRDEIWMRELDGVSLTMTDDYTATSPAIKSHTPTRKGDSVKVDLQKFDPCLDALDFEKQLAFENSKRQRSLSCNDSFSIVFDENASKHSSMSIRDTDSHSVHLSSGDSRNVSSITNRTVSKQKEEDDDSFIVFAHSKDQSGQLSEAREPSIDKRLERIKEMDSYTKTDSSNHSKKKKKGHRRHWSLDMCVRDAAAPAAPDTKMYLYIQMQLCRRDSLHDWLRQNCTSEARGDQVKVLFSQIVAAVEYVHLAGLIHRDLKPSNIFFAPDGRVKVGDFGLVTAMADGSQDGDTPTEEIDTNARHTYRVGTHLYMSPEQLMGRSYSYKVDIYSLGLVLLELLQPFGTESERVACLMQARNHNYPERFHQHYPQETKVLKMMLSEDPSQRPTAMGVKARAPLYQKTDEKWHFALPSERPTQLGHQSE